MKVATLGIVTKVDEYLDKKTSVMVHQIHVACSDQMLRVTVPADHVFAEMDSVLLSGELKQFQQRFYIDAGRVRLSTAEDRLFLSNAATPAVPVSEPFSVAPLGAVTDKAGKVVSTVG